MSKTSRQRAKPTPILANLETKKKNNVRSTPKRENKPVAPKQTFKKQIWLPYISLFGFLILILLIYFRKTIIYHLFDGEVTSINLSLIQEVHAQEEDRPAKKKSILESSVTYDKVTFRPNAGLEGMGVASSFEVEEISCQDLNNEIYQLGVILYPPEVLNEKFLIKLRDCVVKLPGDHPVKRWMKWVGQTPALSPKEVEHQTFLTEILSSQFNLITDASVKQKIINVLSEVPESTLAEQVLRSYLYLMIGNISRSDNILRGIIAHPPRKVWARSMQKKSIYHRIASSQLEQIFTKLSRHPADRRVFELFIMYFKNFFNQPSLVALLDKIDTSAAENKIDLKFTESIAPHFVHYLRLSSFSVNRRIKNLKDTVKYPLNEQSYWIWPFMEIDPLITDGLTQEISRVEGSDQLWFIYLMENERLSDVYSKKSGKSFLPSRRGFLKTQLDSEHDSMMALYKLIEIGDINNELIQKTTSLLVQ